MATTTVVSGIDLGQATLSACLWKTGTDDEPVLEHRTFATNQPDLIRLKDWLVQAGCQRVGMEATGIYWRPIHHLMEGSMKVIVGNPTNMKGLKGRKTDKIDAQWALAFQLGRLALTEAQLAQIDAEIDQRLVPHERLRLALMTIPGFGRNAAGQLLAELGTDLSDFPTAGHFAVWLGLAPGNNQTGGKAKPAPTRKGNRYLRALLVECAHAASRTRGCWLRDKFLALFKRMPYKKATVAIAHKLALIVYHVIKDGAVYQDQCKEFAPGKSKTAVLAKAIKLIEAQGGQVTLPEAFPEIKVRPRGRPRKNKSGDKSNPPNA